MKKISVIITGTIGLLAVIIGIIMKIRNYSMAISLIGNADGPTSVFVAGRVADIWKISISIGAAFIVFAVILAVQKDGTAFQWWQIAGLIIDLIGMVFLILCIATDMNDKLFLPVALCCIMIASALNLFMSHRNKEK